MIKLKKMLIFVICVLSVVATSMSVYAYTLRYWYANNYNDQNNTWSVNDTIGTWDKNQIKFAHKKLNTNSSFEFYGGNLYAQDLWRGALTKTFYSEIIMANATMKVYGGTQQELMNQGFTVSPTANGVTYYTSRIADSTTVYGNRTKTIYRMYETNTVVVDRGNSAAELRKTCTHEMGHALGWFGHSMDSNDIMWRSGSQQQNLQNADMNHLKQVY